MKRPCGDSRIVPACARGRRTGFELKVRKGRVRSRQGEGGGKDEEEREGVQLEPRQYLSTGKGNKSRAALGS
jgi:hypothetical protein